MNGLMLGIMESIQEFFNSQQFQNFIVGIFTFIPKIMYFLLTTLLSVCDLCQILFRKLAGLDPIMISGEVTKGDSVYQIIMDALFNGQYPALGTIFWSLIVLGVFMLIVTAILATIRIEYNPDKDKGNSKEGIIKNFFKGLFSLLIIPVASIFAMFLTNSLVQVIDTIVSTNTTAVVGAEQYFSKWGTEDVDSEFRNAYNSSYISFNMFGINIPTTTEPFSGTVFKACAYSSNRFRLHGSEYLLEVSNGGADLGIFSSGSITEPGVAADLIDTAFAINAKVKPGVNTTLNRDAISREFIVHDWCNFLGQTKDISYFSKYNVEAVYFFYDLWMFNYIVAFVAIIVIAKLYLTFCMMLMARIFELLSLFLIAPVIIGIMPIDNGTAIGRWRMHYATKFALLLIMVFAMNMVSPVIVILHEIKFFGQPVIDYLVTTLMIVAALSAVNGISTTLSTILFDKVGTDTYNNAVGGASTAMRNFNTGFNATKSLATKTATLPVKTAMATASGINKVYNVAHNAMLNNQEREAIKSNMGYGSVRKNELETRFASMSDAERKAWGEGFLDSDEGKSFYQQFTGATDAEKRTKALEAIEKNNFDARKIDAATGKTKAETRDDLLENMYQYQHKQDLFEHSSLGEGMVGQRGSHEYNEMFNEFNNLKEKDKVELLREGKTSFNSQQQSIRQQRANEEMKKQRRQQKLDGFKKRVGGIVKGVDNIAKPFYSPLQQMISFIPGLELFSKPKN